MSPRAPQLTALLVDIIRRLNTFTQAARREQLAQYEDMQNSIRDMSNQLSAALKKLLDVIQQAVADENVYLQQRQAYQQQKMAYQQQRMAVERDRVRLQCLQNVLKDETIPAQAREAAVEEYFHLIGVNV